VFDENLRRKPVMPSVPAQSTMISSTVFVRPEELPRPIPLGKGKKRFNHLVDIIGPKETDQQALARIEMIYEIQRHIERTKNIMHVMES
jgi:hypothetical protein